MLRVTLDPELADIASYPLLSFKTIMVMFHILFPDGNNKITFDIYDHSQK